MTTSLLETSEARKLSYAPSQESKEIVHSTTSSELSEASSESSAPPLPFDRVATQEVSDYLNNFADCTTDHYEELLGDVSCEKAQSPVCWKNVEIESVLGEGGFSFVFQVKLRDCKKDQGKCSYALKCLKAKVIDDANTLVGNAMDLYVESEILSRLDHPNIIQLEGLSKDQLGVSYLTSDGFFILLEIIETTLLDKLRGWRLEEGRAARQLQSSEEVLDRLQTIAIPICSALEYLHSKRIVVRDLKPENVGFGLDGRVRLFDFGLARDVSTVLQDDVAGSICYMAPEVLLEKGTYLASDVHSLSMVVWEICTLELPMARFQTLEQVKEHVAKRNWRPKLSSGIPFKPVKKLIQQGWSPKHDQRPTVAEFHSALLALLSRMLPEAEGTTCSTDSATQFSGASHSTSSGGHRLLSRMQGLFNKSNRTKA
eukprot:Nitzschia sp. Nitz4//scaffold293_size23253//20922//22205//NITZ4_008510-RA/size23253-processed-gene-0.23-mRNA-1//1//CDS//3329546210//610//frame0